MTSALALDLPALVSPRVCPPVASWATTWRRAAAAVCAGSILLTLSAWCQVPIAPVPSTLQSLVVVLLGVLGGRRLATAAVVAYLVEGCAGLPAFAGGAGGPAPLAGPTGGYLLSFAAAAYLSGALAESGLQGFWGYAAAMAAGHLVMLACGAAWLATFIGSSAAVNFGLLPFLAGTLLKVGVGAAMAVALARRPAR